eukprot:TRINITY_DN40031_c0_g1_i1.p1 TRINITY_DN40031_c0_g1~~TRINITY_DN40031_c0_g1_i1.p1  ORF type:complete len:915 (-),score=148.12 TRINITY_DN40031_c0_g1_i1:38-2782(-)
MTATTVHTFASLLAADDPTVLELSLPSCLEVSLEGAVALSGPLSSNKYLRRLDLSSCGLTVTVAKNLALGLGRNTALKTLTLSHNTFLGGLGVAAIVQCGGPSLIELFCSSCGVSDGGARAVGDALQANRHLQHFRLSSNNLTARGAEALGDGLAKNEALATLELDKNSLGGEGVAAIVRASNVALTHLCCSYCEVSDAGLPAVAAALETNTNLRDVSLRANGLSGTSAKILASAMKRNAFVTALDISSNKGLGSDGVAAIVRDGNAALTELRCQLCGISNDCIAPIASALRWNFYLLRLVADGQEGSPMLQSFLRRNAQVCDNKRPWSEAVYRLDDALALETILRCLGDKDPKGDCLEMQQEIEQRLQQTGVDSFLTLIQAITASAQRKLGQLLPAVADCEVRARSLITEMTSKPLCPVDGLPTLWARARSQAAATAPLTWSAAPPQRLGRNTRSVVVIGPGFDLHKNPKRIECLQRGGWDVHECHVPSTKADGFDRQSSAAHVCRFVEEHRPRAIVVASEASFYPLEMWMPHQNCKVPIIMINVHPQLRKLPQDVVVVLCQGSLDTTFSWNRNRLEELMATGSSTLHFLYHSCGSAWMPAGSLHTEGDGHDMSSLLDHDLLNRLVDAAVAANEGEPNMPPEQHLLETWSGLLSSRRIEGELFLGFSPRSLRQFWFDPSVDGKESTESDVLFEVEQHSKEFAAVSDIFLAEPLQPIDGFIGEPGGWGSAHVTRIHRVQNETQLHAVQRSFDSIRMSLQMQGLPFAQADRARWLFHGGGSCESALSVTKRLEGFNPLLCGTVLGLGEGGDAWACFARDGEQFSREPYVSETDAGEKQVFLCLVMTGLPCLSSPQVRPHSCPEQHLGLAEAGCVLPYRVQDHRYNSTTNSLANPDMFLVEWSKQVYPAYLVTFQC